MKLQWDEGGSAYAVIVALTEQSATLQVNGKLQTVRVAELVRLWDGNFATYWRVPDGYRPLAQGGSTPLFFEQLARQLAQLDGIAPAQTLPQTLSPALRARVLDFQRTHGLKADGQPGPLTLMQIETAIAALTPSATATQPNP